MHLNVRCVDILALGFLAANTFAAGRKCIQLSIGVRQDTRVCAIPNAVKLLATAVVVVGLETSTEIMWVGDYKCF